jgi:hypothetical protein
VGKFLEGCAQGLTLYVRKWAWLNAIPLSRETHSAEPTLNRLEKARRDRGDEFFLPLMPEVPAHDQLVTYLFEVGPTINGAPISHTDIYTWQRNTYTRLDAWEARTLRALSVEYAAETARATDPACPSPTEPVITRAMRDEVALRMRAMMRSLCS